MNMKKTAFLAVAVLATSAAMAVTTTAGRRGGRSPAPMADGEEVVSAKDAVLYKQVRLEMPKIGPQATLSAPSVSGPTTVGQCYKKPRKWIVLEAKYETPIRQEQMTFTWHVLLDVEKADKDARAAYKKPGSKQPRYSYFTTSVTYMNVPDGTHAASVCLHPSYYECYGEPIAVGIEIVDKNGELMDGGLGVQTENKQLGPLTPRMGVSPKALADAQKAAFWNSSSIMDATDRDRPGVKMIERRQGLQDRSKTIWALVFPNDYEMVAQ